MEVMNIISVITFAVIVAVGALLKRFTRRTLSDMDGMGEVTTAQDANVIAKF